MIYEGYIWPDADVKCRAVILRELEEAMPRILEHVQGRDCVIQAGGNVGAYPKRLKEHFDSVVTAEPDRENFRCLLQNVPPDVDARLGAFGETSGRCGVFILDRENCGAHQVNLNGDDVPVLTIDSLDKTPDLIWLDIEGFEYFALKGAENTLRSCKPVVILEEKGLGEKYGIGGRDCGDFLMSMGYSRVDRIGNDNVYKVTE